MVRVFRAETPSDVICACLVANTLPAGDDVLVVCADSSHGQTQEYLDCLSVLAKMHNWKATVDVSGLSLGQFEHPAKTIKGKWYGLQHTLSVMSELRYRLAVALNIPPDDDRLKERLDGRVDELYLAYLLHPDAHSFCKIFPGARKIYYPHTFDSLMQCEVGDYAPVCDPALASKLSPHKLALDWVKEILFGEDSVPLRHLRIDGAYTFKASMPWAAEQHCLSKVISRQTMSDLFHSLPAPAQGYYQGLASDCGPDVGVLLLAPEDRAYEEEAEGYLLLAGHLVNDGARSILVKPHSRNGAKWLSRILDELGRRLSDVKLVVAREHYFYPVEVILSPFRLTACAGMGSTSLSTLRKIYGVRSYCPEGMLLKAYADDPIRLGFLTRWIAECSGDYIAV